MADIFERLLKNYGPIGQHRERAHGYFAFPKLEGEIGSRMKFRGKEMIEGWIVKTIEKYKFHFKPLSIMDDKDEMVVAVQVSGTFDGSPVTLDYHFTIERGRIVALAID